MQFDMKNFALATLVTSHLEDQEEANRIRLLGGMMGGGPAGIVLLAAVAGGRAGPGKDGALTLFGPPRIGPDLVAVPDLPDDPDDALKVLEARGLRGRIREVASDDDKGSVIEADPESGTAVARGTTVDVRVSIGLKIPDVVGVDVAEAGEVLDKAGFKNIAVEVSDKTGEENTVESQNPPAGEFADDEQDILLVVYQPRKLQAAHEKPE